VQSRVTAVISAGLLIVGATVARPQKVTQETIQLQRFGFTTGSCESRQTVQFLDDNRLLLSAPLVGNCDKSNWSSALNTQLTVIDLHGAVLATKARPDVYGIEAGPIGFAAVCTATSLELISSDLNTARVISTRPSKISPCSGIDGLSPSRTAISVRDFDENPKSGTLHRLIVATSDQPLAEQQISKPNFLAGITDSGYGVCVEHEGCAQLTVDGKVWAGRGGDGRGLFLSPNQMLLPLEPGDKVLMLRFPDGRRERVADLRGLAPPNVDNPSVQISAVVPRRILYAATGCYIGDFDDCYAFTIGRVVMLDPQTHQTLFKQKVSQGAKSILSPNGHSVVVLDKTKLEIYKIP
jgi:hypothetical protein